MRILCLDVGDRRIGVAMSDPTGMLATSYTVIDRKDQAADWRRITAIMSEFEVEKVVVGVPRSLDGTIGLQAEKVMDFMDGLQRRTRVPVVGQDEWMSTVAVNRSLTAAGIRGKHRRERVDAEAAAYILQGYLDRERLQLEWGARAS
jgi:putative Holliday junction resolvase